MIWTAQVNRNWAAAALLEGYHTGPRPAVSAGGRSGGGSFYGVSSPHSKIYQRLHRDTERLGEGLVFVPTLHAA